jgi:hypothetical protein
VWNDLGEVFLPLRITTVVRHGVVCSEKGAWLRTSLNGQTVSALAPAHKADLAEGACFNDARVDVQARTDSGISVALEARSGEDATAGDRFPS